MIVVIDYGVGNLNSICNMFEFIGIDCRATSEPDEIAQAQGIILPGVGSFDNAMSSLRDSDTIPCLEKAVFAKKTPLLGVCLGMQILGVSSDEGVLPGLGWIDASCEKIDVSSTPELKVPNNGWRHINPSESSVLFNNLPIRSRFYFNHSYVMRPREEDLAASFQYGGNYCCAVESRNIFGVQFHPEKSHSFGMSLLSEFARLVQEAQKC